MCMRTGCCSARGDQNQLPLASYAVENWELNSPDLSHVASLAKADRPCFLWTACNEQFREVTWWEKMQVSVCCFPGFSLLTGRISFFQWTPVPFAAVTWQHSACRWQVSVGDQVLVALATLHWLCASQHAQDNFYSMRAGLAGFSCSWFNGW